MNRRLRMLGWFAAFFAVSGAGTVLAHESPLRAPVHGEPAVRGPQADSYAGTHATIDPLMRALVIGIAASILREAAAQPDPVEALGDAVERRLSAALANPNTMRMAESALQQALQDAPPELREPLAAFALSVLRNMRRDMLAQPRRGY
jgi:hypothetical protein